ncbi:MAG TPA: glycosyltransferase family 4 protein [Terriglobales bacterium]|nr:glycosyltransferase family 4 protein [Terriglobales bacterium]
MRILFASDDDQDIRVGAVKATMRLAEGLRARGHECTLIWRAEVGARPHNERLRLFLSPWVVRRAVIQAWKETGAFDVIDAAGAEGFALALLRWISCYRKARIVVRSHGFDRFWYRSLLDDHHAGHGRKPWPRRILFPLARLSQERGAMRLADRVLVLNRRGRNLVIDSGWQPPERVHLIPHGALASRIAEAPPADAERGGGILFSGYWQAVKGIHYLAEAYRQLWARGVRVPLTLLSATEDMDRETFEIEAMFAPECRPGLRILMRTDDQDFVFGLYRSHDLLVCPSNFEGFGLVVIEALSQRLPVVCTDGVGAADLLKPGIEIEVVPVRNAGALADAMATLLGDPGRRRRMAEAGFTKAQELTWDHAIEATLQVYKESCELT